MIVVIVTLVIVIVVVVTVVIVTEIIVTGVIVTVEIVTSKSDSNDSVTIHLLVVPPLLDVLVCLVDSHPGEATSLSAVWNGPRV